MIGRLLFFAALALPVAALAQQPSPPQQPQNDPLFMQGALGAVQAQRNDALDRGATLAGQLAAIRDQLQKLQGEFDAYKKAHPDAANKDH